MADHATDAARIAELEADNQRLRRLLDQRDVSSELRHRLRSTLALLRTIIRRSAETNRDRNAFVAHLEDRLDTLARAQTEADERGVVGLHNLLADELLRYGVSEGRRVSLSGPNIDLQPRAGQVFALAIHELAVNAIEHGALRSDAGHIAVEWSVETPGSEAQLTMTWREAGVAGVVEPTTTGFGMETLMRTLAYEFKADTDVTFEPGGLRCTIRLPLTSLVGTLANAAR